MANTQLGYIPSNCLNGHCYYCGRELISAVALPVNKTQALYSNRLTCGPCVHVHGRPRWTGNGGLRRWVTRKRLR